ncbi:hypothetical protein Tsubulata_051100 [Turnera subulata]|uniref:Endonuclease/exonuclease/phosphatase domain-containing protein n=1 Tax=Turnera subulata TaxID=218843 RepID=A0A9Q0FRZ4_9ROSI|nr:hypothetical protein Tsubulata_051100 [Turnera subulata]
MIPILAWNCQGAGKKHFVRTFKELCFEAKPEVAVIVEPRVSGRRADTIIRKLNFSNSHRVEARGFAGGIWILWKDVNVDVSVIFNHTQFIHTRITCSGFSFLFTAVYGSPQESWRYFLWKNLENLGQDITEPWLLGGDFNAILSGAERKNKLGRCGIANKRFVECVSAAGLLDLGAWGSKFTWYRGGDHARLDRFLCNQSWRTMFPEVSVIHGPRAGSLAYTS